MAYQQREKFKDTIAILNLILKEYTPISRAPTAEELEMRVGDGITLENVINSEQLTWYKSVETATGDIYLAQNPALAELQLRAHPQGQKIPVFRRRTRFLMRQSKAMELAKKCWPVDAEEKTEGTDWQASDQF